MDELTSEEVAKIIQSARVAKSHGFCGIFMRFQSHRIVDLKVEMSEAPDALSAMYKKGLTPTTSGARI